MSSFIFNDFKERFVNGKVPKDDVWYAYPVTSKFLKTFETDDIKTAQFKNSTQMDLFSNRTSGYSLNSTYVDFNVMEWAYTETRNERAESDGTVKPTYVTKDNWDEFIKKYPQKPESMNRVFYYFFGPGEFNFYGGFYWVTTKEELAWCANRVNGYSNGEYTDNYNDRIAIVLGDDIGPADDKATKIKSDGTTVDNRNIFDICIGKNANRPFNGLLWGNGYKIQNFIMECTTDCNGIVGYLGPYGIINHVTISGNNKMRCMQKLNMTHIKEKGTDIETSLLCGHSNGLISFCNIQGSLEIEDFIPAIYPVENRTENVINPVGDPDENMYYPKYMCINSPGNIIPYIGYFNEGIIGSRQTYEYNILDFDPKLDGKPIYTAPAPDDEDSRSQKQKRMEGSYNHWWIFTNDKGIESKQCNSLIEALEYKQIFWDMEKDEPISNAEYAGKKWTLASDKPPLIVYTPWEANYSKVKNHFIENDIELSAYCENPKSKELFSWINNDDNYGVGAFFGGNNFALMYDYENANYVAKETLPAEAGTGTPSPALTSKNFGFMSRTLDGAPVLTEPVVGDCMSACPWMDAPAKLHQFSRQAYYLSPLAGWSKGQLNYNTVNVNVKFNNEFVGFLGGAAGKFAGGYASNNKVNLNVSDSYYRNTYVLSAASDLVNNVKQLNFMFDSYTPTSLPPENNTDAGVETEYDFYSNPDYIKDDFKLEEFDLPWKDNHNFFGTYIDIYGLDKYKYTETSATYKAKTWEELNQKLYKAVTNIAVKGSCHGFVPNSRSRTVKTQNDYPNGVLMAAQFNTYDSSEILNGNVIPQSAHNIIPLSVNSNLNWTVLNIEENDEDSALPYNVEIAVNTLSDSTPNLIIPENEYEIDPANGWIKISACPTFFTDYLVQEYKQKESDEYITGTDYDRLFVGVFDASENLKLSEKSLVKKTANLAMKNMFEKKIYNSVIGSLFGINLFDTKSVVNPFATTVYGVNSIFNGIKDEYVYNFKQALFDFGSSQSDTKDVSDAASNNIIDEIITNRVLFNDKMNNHFEDGTDDKFKHRMLGNFLKPKVMWFEKMNPYENENAYVTNEDGHVFLFNGQCVKLKAMSGIHMTCVKDLTYIEPTADELKWTDATSATGKANITFSDLYIDYLDESRIIQSSSGMTFTTRANECCQQIFNYKLDAQSKSYIQELKSIHNIGGFAGDLVYNRGAITDNQVSLFNQIQYQIDIKKDSFGEEYLAYEGNTTHDYSMLNRWGAFAAVCDVNSNIASDGWSNAKYPLVVSGNKFKYDESQTSVVGEDNHKKFNIGPMQLGQHETYGVASPLIAEVKPTYLSVPSIQSYNASYSGTDWNENPTDGTSTNNLFGYSYHGLFTGDHGLKWDNYDDYVYTYNQNLDMPSINAWNKEDAIRQVDAEKIEKDNWFDVDISKMICKMFDWKSNSCYLNDYNIVNVDWNEDWINNSAMQYETEDCPMFSAVSLEAERGYRTTSNPINTITYPLAAEDLQYNYDVLKYPEIKRKRSWRTRACNIVSGLLIGSPRTISDATYTITKAIGEEIIDDMKHISIDDFAPNTKTMLTNIHKNNVGLTRGIAVGVYRLLAPTTRVVQKETYETYNAFAKQKKSSLYPYFGSSLGTTSGHKFWYDCCMAGEMLEDEYNDDPELTELSKNRPDTSWDGNIDMTPYTYDSGSCVVTTGDTDIFTYEYSSTLSSVSADGSYKKADKLTLPVHFAQDGLGRCGYWAVCDEGGYSARDFEYKHNVLHFGNEKSPISIRSEIRNNDDFTSYTSSVSGNDFQGLYITDSAGNNVMYIDTKVGDLNGYSIWSKPLPSFKKHYVNDRESGLLLEIK